MTEYRKWYNQAKGIIAKKYNKELHEVMVELGYVKKEKAKKEEKKEEKKKNQFGLYLANYDEQLARIRF